MHSLILYRADQGRFEIAELRRILQLSNSQLPATFDTTGMGDVAWRLPVDGWGVDMFVPSSGDAVFARGTGDEEIAAILHVATLCPGSDLRLTDSDYSFNISVGPELSATDISTAMQNGRHEQDP
jgi:hypothetical protein